MSNLFDSVIHGLAPRGPLHFYPAATFPTIHPVHWLTSHFAVGGFSPLQRLSGMLTAHMTRIAPRNGFTWHPHRGLEIYTYVIDGVLYHEDSTGGSGEIRAGEVQRMFSGHYIAHQELNRTDVPTRVIQIWYVADPRFIGLPAHYEQLHLNDMPAQKVGDGLRRHIIGPQGATDAHVTGRLSSTLVPAGGRTRLELPQDGEELFLYFVDGSGQLEGPELQTEIGLYDVLLATPDARLPTVAADTDGPLTFLSFYLPPFMSAAPGVQPA